MDSDSFIHKELDWVRAFEQISELSLYVDKLPSRISTRLKSEEIEDYYRSKF